MTEVLTMERHTATPLPGYYDLSVPSPPNYYFTLTGTLDLKPVESPTQLTLSYTHDPDRAIYAIQTSRRHMLSASNITTLYRIYGGSNRVAVGDIEFHTARADTVVMNMNRAGDDRKFNVRPFSNGFGTYVHLFTLYSRQDIQGAMFGAEQSSSEH